MMIVFTYSFSMPSKCSCLFVDLCSTGSHGKRMKQTNKTGTARIP